MIGFYSIARFFGATFAGRMPHPDLANDLGTDEEWRMYCREAPLVPIEKLQPIFAMERAWPDTTLMVDWISECRIDSMSDSFIRARTRRFRSAVDNGRFELVHSVTQPKTPCAQAIDLAYPLVMRFQFGGLVGWPVARILMRLY
jgi:hypothetical protein